MNTNLVILAGGMSSRMKTSINVAGLSEAEIKAANTQSKALMVYGEDERPILDFLLKNAEKAGYKNVYIIVGEAHEGFKEQYGSEAVNTFGSLQLRYAVQYISEGREKPFGTADAVSQALEQYPHLLEEAFTVCNCDNLYSVNALKALKETTCDNAFMAYDRDGLNFPTERIMRFALALLSEDNHLVNIIEKPSEEEQELYRDAQGILRVSMNIFKFHGPSMTSYLMDCPPHPIRNEKELPTAILNYCKEHPGNFLGIPINEHVPDLTSKEDIKTFKEYLGKLES
ncbi:sugar phosphate nucleotidyltransferase [Aureisphaera galaxeae]|uniref:sugar phosphate nucleotidyltransferase n=1 Tax=Aureisphaera galaxeae TaxID=1538023 RepID=UPI002350BE75|nr:sugar phosphate nucleotidyltransferase [Aureisphaera galaxeae]MDC8006371.1 sugar phosphate nucleotidyltransferase [Aureisphaera galaxeae]